MTAPSRATRRSAIIRSTSRRLATPARARSLAMRSPWGLSVGGGMRAPYLLSTGSSSLPNIRTCVSFARRSRESHVAEAVAKQKLGWRALIRALRNRKTGFMALFGFASGLPFALFLGTLYAWLTEAGVDLETMGVFSLIGLAYAFQFLWSPLLNRFDIPGL